MPPTAEAPYQYEAWAYPPPVEDLLVAIANGLADATSPSICAPLLWPSGNAPATPRILVAGCGSVQAALLAHLNPGATVVGIDLSGASLGNQARLRDRHALANLELHQLDIRHVGTLGHEFDLIVSTGVLHHMTDPDLGLRALRDVLARNGAMALMLYGRHYRAGLYMLQEAFQRLRLDQTQPGVDAARGAVARLPAWHAATDFVTNSPDMQSDAGLVDALLHQQDRAYSVPEILRFASDNGMVFQSWLDSLDYEPRAFWGADHPLLARILSLPAEDRWAVMELMVHRINGHSFILRRPDADFTPVRFDDPAFLSLVPQIRSDATVKLSLLGSTLVRRGLSTTLDSDRTAILVRVTGKTTVAEILKHLPATTAGVPTVEFARGFFASLHAFGHLLFRYG